MSEPKRVQLSRRKGYKKPAGAVVVSRPSKWGNPYRVAPHGDAWTIWLRQADGSEIWSKRTYGTRDLAAYEAIAAFRANLIRGSRDPAQLLSFALDDAKRELAGHDLACWCRPDQMCHADVLLQLANGGVP